MSYAKNLCFCGYAYDGEKCKELQEKYPKLGKGFWHRSYCLNQPASPEATRADYGKESFNK